ncbi:bacteriophage protein gp37 [Mycobacteroides abscessus subsp. abscessus]|nr:bacteriophage protein gp37 [Mycobacteroides abscessus subsp. abscessus]SKM14177.1 bacteriophage protein gp37 [Mycobacteroides abscessus subsp. massiliense]SID73500.1 bacteriophage protein gp37 [Mycobacteroides abscessus subsp. abscessus]SIK17484.1 bacteriophage protein gp37 [Mycobacteroides abscessus subsp. abscessus]SIM41586.1 bacteriophage protein gp37 [Mycobacteroides abscessus subsp. abscessus]
MMGDKTRIEWADATWSPVTGCTRVSDGCLNCYIERSTPIRVAGRKFDGEGIGSSLAVQLHPNRLDWPLRKRAGEKIFVCSQADLFHDDVPDEYIAHVFAVMALAPQHTFQVLTKRHGRMRSLLSSHAFWTRVGVAGLDRDVWLPQAGVSLDQHHLPNVWLGVSAEDQKRAELRIPFLMDTPAAVRFVSLEPLLSRVDLWPSWLHPVREEPSPENNTIGRAIGKANGVGFIDWVIVGGESGPGARPMHPDWARSLRDQCVAAGVQFLFKQWGEWVPERLGLHGNNTPAAFLSTGGVVRPLINGKPAFPPMAPAGDMTVRRVGKKRAGRELDGRIWDQFPEAVA